MALLMVNSMSRSLMRSVSFHVILPVDKIEMNPGDGEKKKPFKTLYLLHGIFGNTYDWVTTTRIQKWAQEKNLCVVMPSGENGFYVDNKAAMAMHGEFIGQELVELTRKMFPLSSKREDTFIAGLSMGGYGALRNGLKYADTFGAIGALSAALVVEESINYGYAAPTPIGNRGYFESVFGDLEKLQGTDVDIKALVSGLQQDGKTLPAIYMACGTEDSLLERNRDLHKYMDENTIPHTYEEGPGAHTWEFWDEYIAKVLDWLPLEQETVGIHSGNVQ